MGAKPAQRLTPPMAEQVRPEKIINSFNGRAQKILLKGNNFFWLCLLADARTSRFPPPVRLRRAEQAGKNSFPPDPLFFLPACLGFALKNFVGGAKKMGSWWV